jgi:Ca2+-binding EF-hand superfamily protein
VKAFRTIDYNQDGLIDAQDIIEFMKKQYLKLTFDEAELIVKEFDADMDG